MSDCVTSYAYNAPVTVECDGDLIVVSAQFADKELIKSIPGSSWSKTQMRWTVPRTWAACLQLRAQFGQRLVIGPLLAQWSHDEYEQRVRPCLELRQQLDRVAGYPEHLYAYQTGGVEMLIRSGEGMILADDMGLGKTAQVLAALDKLISDNGVDDALPAIVICPNSVKTGWHAQVAKWDIPVTPYVITGGAAARRKIIIDAAADPSALVIVNYDAIRQLSRLAPYGSIRLRRCRECDPRNGEEDLTAARCEVHPRVLNEIPFRTVIVDEAHALKSPQSKQTRAVWAIAHGASVRRRWAMTGTPIANNISDLWPILHMIAPREHPTRSKYIDTYGLLAWNAFAGIDVVGVNPHRRDEFYKIIDPRLRRTHKSLVRNNLPPIVRMTRWVDMVPKQHRAYHDLETRQSTILDTGMLLQPHDDLANALRMLQLSSSYADVDIVEAPAFKPSGERECLCRNRGLEEHAELCPNRWKITVTLTEPSPKLDAMEELIDDLGDRQVVVAAMSRQLIEMAAKRLTKRGTPYGMITGGVSEWERQDFIRRFGEGELQAMLVVIQAGGTGVDGLQVADTLICLQRHWSLVQNLQMDSRVHRIGSERHTSVTIIDVVTQGTIEETRLYPKLREKLDQLDIINRDRARLAAAGVDPQRLYELDVAYERVTHGDNLLHEE